MTSSMFPVSCSLCCMQFKDAISLGEHVHSAHAEELAQQLSQDKPDSQKYVQTIFTPTDLKVLDALVTIGLVTLRDMVAPPNILTELGKMSAVSQYSQFTSKETKQALFRLAQVVYGTTQEKWDKADAFAKELRDQEG